MTSPVGKIDELIAACQARLEDAQQKLSKAEQRVREAREGVRDVEAELRGLNSARDSLSGSSASRQRTTVPRQRGLSSTWSSILRFVGTKGDQGASIDDIEAFAASTNLDVQRGAIRSQLSNYKHRGALETIGDAQYKLTPEGRELLDEPTDTP